MDVNLEKAVFSLWCHLIVSKFSSFINVITGKYFKGFNPQLVNSIALLFTLAGFAPEKGEFLGEFCGLQFPLGIWVPPCVLWLCEDSICVASPFPWLWSCSFLLPVITQDFQLPQCGTPCDYNLILLLSHVGKYPGLTSMLKSNMTRSRRWLGQWAKVKMPPKSHSVTSPSPRNCWTKSWTPGS